VAYTADLATATSMAPQLGTLSGSTVPTSTQATVIWGRAHDQIRAALLANGLSTTPTGSSVAEGWVQRIEIFLTSGEVLLAKETIGPQRSARDWHASQQLIFVAKELLDSIPSMRLMLIENGLDSTGSADARVASHWTRAKDPEWDPTPGTGDQPYASVPIFPDDSDL